MKRLFIILVAAMALGWAGNASATITKVQIVQTLNLSTGGTSTIAATGTGNILVTCAFAGGAPFPAIVITSITDGGDTFVLADKTGAFRAVECWYALTVAAGTTTLTYNFTGSGFADVVTWELHASLGHGFTIDVHQPIDNQPTSTTPIGASVTTTGLNDIVIAALGQGSASVTGNLVNGGETFTCDKCSAGTNSNEGFSSLLNVAAGAHQPKWQLDATSGFSAVTVAFTETPALPHTGGQLISAPLLPQVTPSATYPPDTGYTLTAVASGANLQTAINAAACGTKLNLAHGGTFTAGSAWTLPNNSCSCHTDPTKWQIIQGDQFEANYVPGVRIDPSVQYAQFPHLSNSDGNYAFTANTNGASCWGFAGLDVTETTDGATAVLSLGDGSVTVANFPHDFAVWGSSIHGQASKGVTRCIVFNGNWGAIVDDYLSDCHKVGQDTQAVEMWDGLGPLLVQNTFLEGAAENILIGGSDPHAGVIPSDFTFQKNHFFKPLSWRVADPSYAGIHWSVKNIFELKDAQRVLVQSNVFENVWGDAQNGQAIPWNTSNQGGNDPQATISDVTFFLNIVRHAGGSYVFGANNNPTRQPDHRISIHDNLNWDLDSCKWGSCFTAVGSGPDVSFGGAGPGPLFCPYDIWIVHETFASPPLNQSQGIQFQTTPNCNYYGEQIKDSIIDSGQFGALVGNGVGGGDGLLVYLPGAKVDHDCMYGPDGSTYLNAAWTGRQNPANQAAVFVNPGVDFHVSGASVCHNAASDGTDMGANIDAVNAATAGVTEALANPHTVTNVSPSTFTHLGSTSITITGTNFISGAAEVIIGGAGPVAAVAVDICAVNTCDVVTSVPITLAVNDTVNMYGMLGGTGIANSDQGQFTVASVTDTTHFTYTDTGIGVRSWTGGTANRITPGNACASVVVVNSTTITCTTPAATGTVTNGPVSVFVSQFGIPAQFNGANYN